MDGLNDQGIRAAITWLPHRAEYAPWTVAPPPPPEWANIVHVNTWLHCRFLPQGFPLVATVHHSVHDPAMSAYKGRLQALYHALWIKKLEATVLERAKRIVADSRYTADQVRKTFNIQNIATIYIGMGRDIFCPASSPKPPRDVFRLLFIGTWSRRKGVDLLGPIMQQLGSSLELHYTGNQDASQRNAALPENCHCIGRPNQADLVKAMQQADALLFPTRLEGFGLVAAEAMACGLPVIASDCSSIPEVVIDGETGLLCPSDNVAAFCAAARRLREDSTLYINLCRQAPQAVQRRFSMSGFIQSYLQTYREVLDLHK